MNRLFANRNKQVTSITIEHGVIKLLACQGLKVIDYRVIQANPRYFREGQVNSTNRVASLLQGVLPEMNGNFRRVIGGVPGFQNRLRLMDFPKTQGLDPNVIIPQVASRSMRVSTDTYDLSWLQLGDRLSRTRWLVLATSRRSISSLADTVQQANMGLEVLEPRVFALARAVNQPEAVVAWAAPDGCDVVVVKDSVPVEHQSLYWGPALVEDSVLIDRLTEVMSRTISNFDSTSPEGPISNDAPLFVCGSPISRESIMPDKEKEQFIRSQLTLNLNRQVVELVCPLDAPEDFPMQDLIVNVGLILREA